MTEGKRPWIFRRKSDKNLHAGTHFLGNVRKHNQVNGVRHGTVTTYDLCQKTIVARAITGNGDKYSHILWVRQFSRRPRTDQFFVSLWVE